MPKPYYASKGGRTSGPTRGGNKQGKDGDGESDDETQPVLQRAQPDDEPKPACVYNTAQLPFGVLCTIYDELEKTTRSRRKHKTETKGDMIGHFFQLWRERIGNDLYPVVRLMLPERDTRRRTYNLKEQKLAKALVDALDLPGSSTAANKLIYWKMPTKDDPGAGEFASVAYEVIKSRSIVTQSRSDSTIETVNEVLDQLSTTTSTGPNGEKRSLAAEHAKILKRCIGTMTPGEMKWLIRIILRDLKIGVGEKTIFDRLHPDAMSVFNTCSDIMKVCYKLWDPNHRISREDTLVQLMQAFKPMLCWRSHSHLEDVVKAMHRARSALDPQRELEPGEYANREFIVEEKLDGERIQLHMRGKEYKYWSRKAIDYTYLYGSSPSEGSLTPFIQDGIDDSVEEVVLDGEMLVWEPHVQKYMPFGNLKSFAKTKTSHIGDFDPRPCFKVFDVLYIKGKGGEGQCLVEKPLWRRKLLLSRIIKDKTGIIEIADCAKGSTKEEIHSFLMRILEERGEGLVVKHPLSKYVLGGREDSWIKIKPEYMDELGENIDGLVIGGYWGQGRRHGIMASYLIGLLDTSSGERIYHTFAKVGSGFSRSAYEEIARKTDGKWRIVDRGKAPKWFHTVSEWPDAIIEPHESFVITIKAAEIVKGDDYGAGLTLRFPRAMKMSEKPWDEAEDFETILAYRRAPKRQHFGEVLSSRTKKVRAAPPTKRHAISEPLGQVEAKSDLLAGTTFYIHRTEPEDYKTELKRLIAAHGGTLIEKIPDPDTDRVVVSCAFTGLKNRKGAKDCDVVTPEWVKDSIANGRRMPLQKRYLVNATEATIASADYDDQEDLDIDLDGEVDENAGQASLRESEDEDAKPAVATNLPQNAIKAPLGSREHWRERHGLDSEEGEPDTEEEDVIVVRSGTDGESENTTFDAPNPTAWEGLFPRQQILPPILHGVNRDLGRLDVDDSDTVPPVKSEPDSLLSKLQLDPLAYSDAPVGMGAGDDSVEGNLDPDRWLAPFVAYFDTQLNAEANELPPSNASGRIQAEADKSLEKAKTNFEKAGGRATDDLQDAKLTHIIVSRLVPDRYTDLIRRTLQPRARRIVTTEWVEACMEEEGAMDENDFKP